MDPINNNSKEGEEKKVSPVLSSVTTPMSAKYSDKQGITPVPSTMPPMAGLSDSKHDQIFKGNKWRDVWALILFYVHLGLFIALFVMNFKYLSKLQSDALPTLKNAGMSMLAYAASAFLVMIGLTVLLIVIFLFLIYKFPVSMIRGSFIGTILLSVGFGILMFFVPNGMFAGIIFLVFAAIDLLIFFLWRRRIKFSGVLLKNVVSVLRIYPATWNLAVLSIVAQVAFAGLYIAAFTEIALKYTGVKNPKMDGIDIASIVYITFSAFWTSQVIKNVIHTSVCGVFASYYFLYGSGAAIIRPVSQSLKRALTYSFGSVAFGSLIIALIQLLRSAIRSVANDRDSIAAACADCILGMIESLVEYFNYYGYVQVAIYNKSYIEAAKDTWSLVKSHGVDAVINDSLVGTCLGLGVFLIACIAALGALAACAARGMNQEYLIITPILTFLFSFAVASIATQVVESGVSATFVCLAEDPAAMQRTKPELYNAVAESYSQIIL